MEEIKADDSDEDNSSSDEDEIKEDWPVRVIDLTGNEGLHIDLRVLELGEQKNTVNFTGYSYDDAWMFGMNLNDDSMSYNTSINDYGLKFDFHSSFSHEGFICSWNKTTCVGSLKMGKWMIDY